MWRVLIAGHSGIIDCNFYFNILYINDVIIVMLFSYNFLKLHSRLILLKQAKYIQNTYI